MKKSVIKAHGSKTITRSTNKAKQKWHTWSHSCCIHSHLCAANTKEKVRRGVCYLEIFRVIHFFVWTLSFTVIWNLKALLWRQRLTRTLIFIDNWHNGDGLENSFCPPTPAGVRQETGPGPRLVDTELPLLLRAHWLAGRDNSELLLCVIAKWNCSAQQLCWCFQNDMGAKVFIPERWKLWGADNGCC